MKKKMLLFLFSAALAACAVSPAAAATLPDTGVVSNLVVLSEAVNGPQPEGADTLLIRVDESGNATAADGAILGPLSSFDAGGRIPVYHAGTLEAADAVIAHLAAVQDKNALVCSTQPALVKYVRSKISFVRGAIDLRAKSYDDAGWVEIRDTVNENDANVALVSAASVTPEMTRFLHKLLITVWVQADTEQEICRAALCEANGVLTAAPLRVRELLAALTGNVLLQRPIVISHRGLSGLTRENGTNYHENTVEAARAAYEQCGAEVVEIDLYLTGDDRVVIMHDNDIARTTTGAGAVESYTLSQLRRYKVDGGETGENVILEDIPLLDDYFEAFRDTDLHYFLEIKSTRPEVVTAAKQVIEKYGMQRRVAFISFHTAQLAAVRREMPYASVGMLDTEIYADDNDFTDKVADRIGALNATFNPSYENVTAEAVAELNKRGVSVWPWTYRQANQYAADYVDMGFSGITLDYCAWMQDWARAFQPDETAVSADAGAPTTFACTVTRYDGKTERGACEAVQIGGDLVLVSDGGGRYHAEGSGTALVVFVYQNVSPYYTLVSGPVTLQAKSAPKKGCGGGCSSAAALAVLPALALAVYAGKRRL